MPFTQIPNKRDWYDLHLIFNGRALHYTAHMYQFHDSREYWYIKANNGIITVSFNIKTRELKDEHVYSIKIPADFLRLLTAEFQANYSKKIS